MNYYNALLDSAIFLEYFHTQLAIFLFPITKSIFIESNSVLCIMNIKLRIRPVFLEMSK